MQLFSRALPDECTIYLASDLHTGSLNTSYGDIGKLVEEVGANKKGYLMLLGDLIEAICVDDHRFDPETNDPALVTPLRQAQKIVEILKPISKKILHINDGNHEYKLSKVINITRDLICRELDVQYGTYSSKTAICDSKGNQRFKIFTGHGWGSIGSTADDPIRRKSNMELSLKRKLAGKAGDCHIMAIGHTHKLLTVAPTHGLFLTDDGGRIQQHYHRSEHGGYIHPDHRWYANTGSFLKLYNIGTSGYAERFGYDPVELGYIKVTISGGIHNVEKVVV